MPLGLMAIGTNWEMRRRDALQLVGLSSLALLARSLGLAAIGAADAAGEAAPGQTPDVDLALTAAPDEVSLLPGAPTRVWRFTAKLLHGPATTLQSLPGSCLTLSAFSNLPNKEYPFRRAT